MNELKLEFEKPILELQKKIEEMKAFSADNKLDVSAEINALVQKLDEMHCRTGRHRRTYYRGRQHNYRRSGGSPRKGKGKRTGPHGLSCIPVEGFHAKLRSFQEGREVILQNFD